MVEPEFADLERQLSEVAALLESKSFAKAADRAYRCVSRWPHSQMAIRYLAEACLMAGYLEEAERLFLHLLQQQRSVHALVGVGVVLTARGQAKEAENLFREAIQSDPGNAKAWTGLSKVHKFRRDDVLIKKLKRQLQRKDLSLRSRRDLGYVLSEAMNQTGHPARAWDLATKAASVDTPPYDPDALRQMVESADRVCTAEFCAPRPERGLATQAPIFVVGMPRSGTTLVSMILSMVPDVTVAGELTTIPHIASEAAEDDAARGNAPSYFGWLARWRDENITALAEHYLADVARRSGGQVPMRFVDKLPANVMFLGQIACMFPNARIVRMVRDPLDTCVSCYLGRFGNGNTYTYRTDWLADAYLRHQQAGEMMAPRIPNPVHTLRYEDLVTNPEAEIRKLLAFLDLPWTDACLTPEQSSTMTTTRSVAQVRGAINSRSVGRWRRYADRIGPLAAALGIDVDERPAA